MVLGTVAGHAVGAQRTFVDSMHGWGRFQSLQGWKAEGGLLGLERVEAQRVMKALGPKARESRPITASVPGFPFAGCHPFLVPSAIAPEVLVEFTAVYLLPPPASPPRESPDHLLR